MMWMDVRKMPANRVVEIKTVSGLHRHAKRSHYGARGPDKWGPYRVHCWATLKPKSGDLYAVAWREVGGQ